MNQLLSVFHKEPKQRAPHYFAHTYLSLFCSKTVTQKKAVKSPFLAEFRARGLILIHASR